MEPDEILRQLVRLAGRVGVVVRSETFDLRVIEGRGGLCVLRGVPTVMMDANLPLLDKIGVLADALGRMNLEAIYVPPLLRRNIERRAAKDRALAFAI